MVAPVAGNNRFRIIEFQVRYKINVNGFTAETLKVGLEDTIAFI